MATITLEVPDELAQRLVGLSDQLPALLSTILDREELSIPSGVELQSRPWQEVIRFFGSAPHVSEILAYRLPEELQERLEELLFLNSEDEISQDELAELDTFLQVNRFLNLLKASLRAGMA